MHRNHFQIICGKPHIITPMHRQVQTQSERSVLMHQIIYVMDAREHSIRKYASNRISKISAQRISWLRTIKIIYSHYFGVLQFYFDTSLALGVLHR